MSQRRSGYERQSLDLYETPEWVTRALIPHIPMSVRKIWEPACGSGKMAEALMRFQCVDDVVGSDISPIKTGATLDFLSDYVGEFKKLEDVSIPLGIVTNPPYNRAQEFCERALELSENSRGFVAMLLRVDFDSAQTRGHLFAKHPAFYKKLILTSRIQWFEGEAKASPSQNHAWFIWDWSQNTTPQIHYHFKKRD